jgi:hypothetical protein
MTLKNSVKRVGSVAKNFGKMRLTSLLQREGG